MGRLNEYSQSRRARQLLIDNSGKNASAKIDEHIKLLSRAAWFGAVCWRLDTTTTASIPILLESTCSTAEDEGLRAQPSALLSTESKLWDKYARAEGSPSASSLQFVEAAVPGTIDAFITQAWRCLDVSAPLRGEASRLLASLSGPVQSCVFDPERLRLGIHERCSAPAHEVARSLSQLATADSLAALVVLLREELEQADHGSLELGRELYTCLLLLSQSSAIRSWLPELTWYLGRYVFPLTENQGVSIEISMDRVARQSRLLREASVFHEDNATAEIPSYMAHQLRDLFDLPELEDVLGPTFKFHQDGSAKSRFLLMRNLSAERGLLRTAEAL